MVHRIIVVTGVSGSGKTTTIKSLEDLGYFCVDNLPQEFFLKFLELAEQKNINVALGVDIRSQYKEGDFVKDLTSLKGRVEVLFLESQKEILVRRFAETRRKHPVRGVKSIQEGIEKELKWVEGLRLLATDIIDTSRINIHELRNLIQKKYGVDEAEEKKIKVQIISFSYRYGIPLEADILIDTRCLPNPHYVPQLQPLIGNNEKIKNFFKKEKEVKAFIEQYQKLFEMTLPLYEKEGRTYLTIAVGCTGGRHRSVYIASVLSEFFQRKGLDVQLSDRDSHRV
ncbi:MAG: RNase adapter RapZ [Deltaproteobacteria bacterium]|nr:RNase adapter RapZ [Deltaproteobacteria bacterium]